MRLKSFTGKSMREVMRDVRAELGDDAIIISSWSESDGTLRVTAALEQPSALPEPEVPAAGPAQPVKGKGGRHGELRDIFDYHGVPSDLATRLALASLAIDHEDIAVALSAALDETFRFEAQTDWPTPRAVLLVGPHGAGKTVTTAKLAARQALTGGPVGMLTTDLRRAAATEELMAYAEILGLSLGICDGARNLAERLGDEDARGPVFIDSAAADPFDKVDMARLRDLAAAARAEPVLVLPAGIDPLEAGDIAASFRAIGVRRLITTRVDVSRRHGGILAAAHAGNLAIGPVGVTPHIADGLATLNPVSLARLLVRDPELAAAQPAMKEAAL